VSGRSMRGRLAKVADRIPATEDSTPWCIHHGPACRMGAVPLSELYRMVIEAKQRQGIPCPPLDEHQAATEEQRTQMRREHDQLLAEARASNASKEAEIATGGNPT
jgi:hypothetical protein